MEDFSVLSRLRGRLTKTADEIWELAETAFLEKRSAALLAEVLSNEGFAVETGTAGIPTAFRAVWGAGGPTVGFLGEYDALSGLSQRAGIAAPEPLCAGGNGHGCGHNLLGVGALAAALCLKEYLEKTGKPGTVVYYGCPAEEGGSGKAFMARGGAFRDLDCAFTWHPSDLCNVRVDSSLANCQIEYTFHGVAAHAGAMPHMGRSALDAAELMNVGANFLREHMIPQARLHYAITDAGGFSPNVVQAKARVLYLIRAPRISEVLELRARVDDIARGAALMTGTSVDIRFIKACSNVIPNRALQRVLQEKWEKLPPEPASPEDTALAAALSATYAGGTPDAPLALEVRPYVETETTGKGGSTDVGDVSWICPTAQVNSPTWPYGVPGHSWQVTAFGKTEQAHSAALRAGRVLASAACELWERPELLAEAKAEHRRRVGPEGYASPIPAGVAPMALE